MNTAGFCLKKYKTASLLSLPFYIKIGGGVKKKTTHLLSTVNSIQLYYEQKKQKLLQKY